MSRSKLPSDSTVPTGVEVVPVVGVSAAGVSVDGVSVDRVRSHSKRNFLGLVVYQIIVRIGWIFKTESIVMPAFVDFLGAGGAVRGCLPMFNRLGQSIPPVFYAQFLSRRQYKKRALTVTTFAMSATFATLAAVWWSGIWQAADGSVHGWMIWVFLAIYAFFFAMVGCNQLTVQTVQGKLIAANRRGILFTVATVFGAPLAIIAVMVTMPSWLARDDGGFGWIFSASAVMFGIAAIAAWLLLNEPPDTHPGFNRNVRDQLMETWQVLRDDSRCRRLAVTAALFGTVIMLFPHYQAMGRERLGLGRGNLLVWVAVQNVATALCTLLAGPLADRFGNRAALHVTYFGAVLAPLWATALALLPQEIGSSLFWIIFLPLGFTPVGIRLLLNFALEVAPELNQARYVSTISLSLAAPVIVFSAAVGQLITWFGYESVFLGGAVIITIAALFTFWLDEPRHSARQVLAEYPE